MRNTEGVFESRLLPLLVNRTRKVAELIPQLYLHGLSKGDFDLAAWGLLGEEVPVSASTVARLKDKWNEELAQWCARPIHMPRFGPWQKCWAGVCVELTGPCLMAVQGAQTLKFSKLGDPWWLK